MSGGLSFWPFNEGQAGGPVITATTDFSALTIFNYGAFNGLPTSTLQLNDQAMSNMLTAMGALNTGLGGGEAWFQGACYAIDAGGTNGYPVPSGCVLRGLGPQLLTSNAGMSNQPPATFTITAASTVNPSVFWNVASSITGHTWTGTLIENLGFSAPPGCNANTVCIILNGSHCIIRNCTFGNFPTAVNLNAVHSGISDSVVQYGPTQAQGPNGGGTPQTVLPLIIMSSPQVFVENCEIEQYAQGKTPPGPLGIAAIAIVGSAGSRHMSIRGNHIVDLDYGVTWATSPSNPNNYHLNIIDNEIVCATSCLYFSLDNATGGNASFIGTRVIGNIIWQSQNATATSAAPVVVDPKYAGNQISDIEFTNNSIYDSLTDGVKINGGSDLKFEGGTIAGNTNAGINIAGATAAVGAVHIQGVLFSGKYAGSPNNYVQQYGVAVNLSNLNSTSVVVVENCTFVVSGSNALGVGALNATGAVPNGAIFIVRNCNGYNDQNTVINTLAHVPLTNNQSANNQGAASGVNYFGPSIIYGTNVGSSTTVTLKNNAITLQAGDSYFFQLNNPADNIKFSQAPLTMFWIGV